jgi:hypothetical protein
VRPTQRDIARRRCAPAFLVLRCGISAIQTPDEPGREECVACRDRPHRADQLIARRVLEQESAGSGLHRLVDVLVEVEGGQHQKARIVAVANQAPVRIDSVDARHANVHPCCSRLRPGGVPRARGALGLSGEVAQNALAVVGILAFAIAVAIALLQPEKTLVRLQHSRPMSLSFDDISAQAGNEPPAA